MNIWIDAQLSPSLAKWITCNFGVTSEAVRDLGLRDAKDSLIFHEARKVGAVVLTKDIDFVHLLSKYGSPPKVLWLTCGNTSNLRVRSILQSTLSTALDMLESGENIVEIADPSG